MEDMILKPEYQALADKFEELFGDQSCYCSTCGNPPCSYCENSGTHDGNPLYLEELDEAWEPTLVGAVRAVVENHNP